MLTDAGIVPSEISGQDDAGGEKKPKFVRWVHRHLRRGERDREWHALDEDGLDWDWEEYRPITNAAA